MEINTSNEAEERIAALERRIRDMEALVRGLTAELLDLKTVAMAKSRQDGERSRQELTKSTVVRGTPPPETSSTEPPVASEPAEEKIVIRPKGVARQEELPAPAAPAEPTMVRIMQPDGTFKLEPRRGNRKMI